MSALDSLVVRWRYFWAKRSGWTPGRRLAARLAAIGTEPYHSRAFLAELTANGFVAPSTRVSHDQLQLGRHVYIGDRCFVFRTQEGGPVVLEDRVCLYGETMIQTGSRGQIRIGADTHVQPRCHFSSHVGPISIGARVEIAPCCAFYSYNHGMAAGSDIMSQPLTSKGGILVGDGAWLGHGVVVLDGVEIGEGAVIAAGSVVQRSIPAQAIAAGVPARVLRQRS